jgi:predicted dienelactone hydrolase
VRVLRDGNFAPSPAKHPLILLSPGSGNNAEQLFWLGQFLAQHDYFVAAVSHNGTDEEELRTGMLTATDFFCWERARDLSVVLTRLLADPELSSRIDPARIGAAGFSLGGATALWLGGARLDLELLRQKSPPLQPALVPSIDRFIAYSTSEHAGRESIRRAEVSYKDHRIKSIFALAPAIGVGFTGESLREVDVPVCIVVGDTDKVAPASTNAQRYAGFIPDAELIVLPGERGHYLSPVPSEQRQMELREVAELALRFFHEKRE